MKCKFAPHTYNWARAVVGSAQEVPQWLSSRQTLTMRTTLVLLSFFRLACSAQIYFYPRISAAGTLPLSVASVLIAQHLHLDRLEPIQDHGSLITGVLDQSFVGKGSYSSLLINIDEADAKCKSN